MDLKTTDMTLPRLVKRDLARLANLLIPASQPLRELATYGDTAERLSRMGDWLYCNWYTRQTDAGQTEPSLYPPVDLYNALDQSTSASDHWQHGWVVLQAEPSGSCLAGMKRISRWLYPGQYANIARPGMPLAPGDALSVNALVSNVDEATGFWVSQSATGMPEPPLFRLYFNVGWQRVGLVLGEVTAWLDSTTTRYSLKYPIVPDITQRVDTLVVYLERSEWDALESAAIDLAQRIGKHLRPATPPLSRHLGAGAACADDPGAGLSFGQSRGNTLAPAALSLIERPQATNPQAITTLANALFTASINPQMPWRITPP